MVGEPSHVKQLSLNNLCKIGLKGILHNTYIGIGIGIGIGWYIKQPMYLLFIWGGTKWF